MRKTRSQTQAENAQAKKNLPDEYYTLHSALMSFRVTDLHRLFQLINLPHAGKKLDLQKRALNLLEKNFYEISSKIKEIQKFSVNEENNIRSNFGPTEPKRMYQPTMQLPIQSDSRNPQPPSTLVSNSVILPFSNNGTQNYPIHPDVRLKKLAFYDVLATLIQPSSLVPSNNQRMQDATFYFTLTPQQATDIASNRDVRNGSKIEHTIQVQLRFCLLETSCEQEDCFPANVIVKVNNKICPLPNPIPTNRPNVEPKRPPRPVNITANVKLSPTVTNCILVQWCPEFTRGYVLSVYLVRRLSSLQLLNRMKTKGIKPADYTRALIKEKLNEDADCEIATTMLRVSLMCPLGKMRMTIPCRASTCSHLQCFDASLFLQMNERKPTWNCPVCDKSALYETLVIDGYFQEVLASSLLSNDDNEIQLHKDGSWSTHVMRTETQILDTSIKSVQKVEVISDDIEVITTEPAVKMQLNSVDINTKNAVPVHITANLNGILKTNEPTSTTNPETVDLTISDSDDDDLPLKRRAATKTNLGGAFTNGQKSHISIPNKTPDIMSSSIISLDSPSPPSSPNNHEIDTNLLTASGVTSTTIPMYNCPLPSDILLQSTEDNNYNLNRMENSRFDTQNTMNSVTNSLACQRLLNPPLQGSNMNVVHPYREANDQLGK